MSDISFSFTPLELASFFAALAFLALALPVAVFCAIVFGVPALRAARGWRRGAIASIVVLVALGTLGAPMLAARASMWAQPFRDAANTVVLREPQTRDGIAYPAGTTLYLDGRTLREDTTVDGYPLAGGTPVETEEAAAGLTLVAGTLRTPLVLYGVRWPAGTFPPH